MQHGDLSMRSIIIAIALASCAFAAPAMAQDPAPVDITTCRAPARAENLPRQVDLICGGTWYETLRIDGQTVLAEIRAVSAEEAGVLRDRAEDERRYRSGRYYRRPVVQVDCMSFEGVALNRCAEIRRDERRDMQRESRMCRNPRYRTSTSCLIVRGQYY